MSVQDKILDAIEILADNSVKKAGYDRTIQAQILSCEDATIGKYRCRYQDATIYAYAGTADITYTKGSNVYILVPSGDMSKEKTILGTTKKLGINYISQAQGDEAYNIIGNNCIISNNIYWLNTDNKDYSYKIYEKGKTSDLDLNIQSLNEYIKQSSSLIVGGIFQTSIPAERQFRGHYGISFNLRFNDNASNQQVVRTYTLDEDHMIDNPYRLVYETRQYEIFDIDGSNFIQIESIEIFTKDFPNASSDITNIKLIDGDIKISSLEFTGATRMTEEEINGVAISFYTPLGTFFTKNSTNEDYKTITAQVRIKGKLASPAQNLQFYWGSQNVGITARNPYYNKYLGKGWKCLNNNNQIIKGDENHESVYTWVPGKDTYTVNFSEVTAKNNKFKVAVLYDGSIISKTIDIKNFAEAPQITIESNEGTKFYYDIGHPTLICKINGIENDLYTYHWAIESDTGVFESLPESTDKNKEYNNYINQKNQLQEKINKGLIFANACSDTLNTLMQKIEAYNYIQRVQKNKIHDVQIKNITNFAIFKCSVYNGTTYLGTASITLTNSLNGEDLYSLVINNGSVVYQYNEYGVAPNNQSLDIKQNIYALSFTIYDNLGKPVDSNIIKNSKDCSIRWFFPIKDTLLVEQSDNGDGSGIDPTGTYRYYDNLTVLVYDIQQRYDIKKPNNQIKLTVDYKGMNLTAETQLTFTKQGEPGTNGTDYVVKIVPNTGMSAPPEYPMVTREDIRGSSGNLIATRYLVNFGIGKNNIMSEQELSSGGNHLFKAQLWHSGDLVWQGYKISDEAIIDNVTIPSSITWGILTNKYDNSHSDYSDFKIVNPSDGLIQFIGGQHLYSNFKTPAANIVKCSITYKDKTYYGTIPIITAWVYNNQFRVELKEFTGFRYVLYSSDGTTPQYDSSHPFEFILKEKITSKITAEKSVTAWEDVSLVNGSHGAKFVDNNNQCTCISCGNVMRKDQYGIWTYVDSNLLTRLDSAIYKQDLQRNQFKFRPIQKCDGECVNNAILCEYRNGDNVIVGRINVPIHFLLNRYGLSNINAWDGNNVQINEQGGYILAPQMGAGKKDNQNRFTGVLMGEVKQNDSSSKTYNGLLGFSQGIISIYLDAETGNATFGRPGEGQIKLVPGKTSTIAGWKINTDSLSSNDNKSILYANEKHIQDNKSLRFNINNLFKVYSNGHIKSTAGTIGGWTIESDSLHTTNKTTFGTGIGSYLGANGIFDFTSSKGSYLRYGNNNFIIHIGDNLFNLDDDAIQLGEFIISTQYGRNMLSNDDNSMAISADAQTGKQWWMWFGGNSGNDPANYDFVLNGGGQLYAKDFICTNSSHYYNICEQIEALWQAIRNIPSGDDDDDDDGNTNNNDSNYNNNDDMPAEGTIP